MDLKELKKYCIDNHRKMWNWLSENPDKNKKDWPGWEEHIGHKIEINHCFLCDYVNFSKGGKCSHCPIDWGTTKKCMEVYPETSYYLLYCEAHTPKLRTKYAKIIANLPEKDERYRD